MHVCATPCSAETHTLSDCTCESWHPVASAGTSQEAMEMRRREFYAIESKAQQPEQQQFTQQKRRNKVEIKLARNQQSNVE